MLTAVQIINCNVCSQGMRQDKRMLELATIVLYGHDGKWLSCLATITKFVTTNPMKRPRGRAVSAPDFGSRGRGFESRWRRDFSRT